VPTTIASKLDDVTDLILTTIRALPEATGVSIYDGPPVGNDAPKQLVMIGDDGDPDSDAESSFDQTWTNLAHTRKREDGEIPGAVIIGDGSVDMKTQRTAAFTLLGAIETALLGLASDVLTISFDSGKARPVQNNKGAACWIPFSVSYSTTL